MLNFETSNLLAEEPEIFVPAIKSKKTGTKELLVPELQENIDYAKKQELLDLILQHRAENTQIKLDDCQPQELIKLLESLNRDHPRLIAENLEFLLPLSDDTEENKQLTMQLAKSIISSSWIGAITLAKSNSKLSLQEEETSSLLREISSQGEFSAVEVLKYLEVANIKTPSIIKDVLISCAKNGASDLVPQKAAKLLKDSQQDFISVLKEASKVNEVSAKNSLAYMKTVTDPEEVKSFLSDVIGYHKNTATFVVNNILELGITKGKDISEIMILAINSIGVSTIIDSGGLDILTSNSKYFNSTLTACIENDNKEGKTNNISQLMDNLLKTAENSQYHDMFIERALAEGFKYSKLILSNLNNFEISNDKKAEILSSNLTNLDKALAKETNDIKIKSESMNVLEESQVSISLSEKLKALFRQAIQ